MRDRYLAKAKLLVSGQWIEGTYCSISETTYPFKEDYEHEPVKVHHCIIRDEMTDWGMPNRLKAYEVDENTICQCAGRAGTNQKKWEGDIIEYHGNWYVIEWSAGDYMWYATELGEPKYSIPLSELSEMDIVVVGNIFDEPELMYADRQEGSEKELTADGEVEQLVEQIEGIKCGSGCQQDCEYYDCSAGACSGRCEEYVRKKAIEIVRTRGKV